MRGSISAIAAAVVLAACGGGGSDSGSGGAPNVASAEGMWVGPTSTGYTLNLLALEDGEFWGIYGANGSAYGAIHGTASWDGSKITAAGSDYYIYGGTKTDGAFTGTYSAKNSVSGTVSGAAKATFSGTYDARYDSPASLTDLAGTWAVSGASSTGTTTSNVTISPTGAIAGSNQYCAMTGTAAPRASGKNVFNVSVGFAGADCLFNGQTLAGVAVLMKSGATTQLAVAALLPDRSNGFLALASR